MLGFDDDGSDWEHRYETKVFGFLAALILSEIAAYDLSLNPAARRILSILSAHTDKDGYAFPSQGNIAKKLKISRPAVSKQIKILEKGKYISVQRRTKSSGGKDSNLYRLNFALAEEFKDKPDAYRAFR